MNTYQNTSFAGETIDLDGGAFRQCVFEDCTLRFSAAGATELNGCSFTRCELAADGAAQLTLSYLRGFYHGLGDWGRGAVDGLFEAIRRPDGQADQAAPDDLAGSHRAALEAFGATPEGQSIVQGFARLSADQRREIAALIGRAARPAS